MKFVVAYIDERGHLVIERGVDEDEIPEHALYVAPEDAHPEVLIPFAIPPEWAFIIKGVEVRRRWWENED